MTFLGFTITRTAWTVDTGDSLSGYYIDGVQGGDDSGNPGGSGATNRYGQDVVHHTGDGDYIHLTPAPSSRTNPALPATYQVGFDLLREDLVTNGLPDTGFGGQPQIPTDGVLPTYPLQLLYRYRSTGDATLDFKLRNFGGNPSPGPLVPFNLANTSGVWTDGTLDLSSWSTSLFLENVNNNFAYHSPSDAYWASVYPNDSPYYMSDSILGIEYLFGDIPAGAYVDFDFMQWGFFVSDDVVPDLTGALRSNRTKFGKGRL